MSEKRKDIIKNIKQELKKNNILDVRFSSETSNAQDFYDAIEITKSQLNGITPEMISKLKESENGIIDIN